MTALRFIYTLLLFPVGGKKPNTTPNSSSSVKEGEA
jgi:hypothetical protein